jgi:hypothetical protein
MDIQEIQQLKAATEKQINTLLFQFTERTTMTVDAVRITPVFIHGGGTMFVVEIDAKL